MTRASTEVKWGQIYISKETPTHHYTHVCLLRAPTHSCLPTSSLPSAIFPPVIQTYSRLQVWIWGVNWRWSHGNHVYHPGEGALRGTRVGLIPIHPVLQPDGQGTIRPSCLPLSLHGDLWPYFCNCRSLSPLCLLSVIIYNIYSHWFKRWPLSSPTLLSWLTKTLKCSSWKSKHHLKRERSRLHTLPVDFLIEAPSGRTEEQQWVRWQSQVSPCCSECLTSVWS